MPVVSDLESFSALGLEGVCIRDLSEVDEMTRLTLLSSHSGFDLAAGSEFPIPIASLMSWEVSTEALLDGDSLDSPGLGAFEAVTSELSGGGAARLRVDIFLRRKPDKRACT